MSVYTLDSVDFCKWPFLTNIPEKTRRDIVIFRIFSFSFDPDGFYCFFVLKSGDVYRHSSSTRELHKIDELCGKEIIGFNGGEVFVIALTRCGRVYSWGNCDYGYSNEFTEISALKGIESVSCGLYHSLAVSFDGLVYSWGRDFYGECGHPELSGSSVETPTKVDFPDGEKIFMLYAFGSNNKGELGIGLRTKSKNDMSGISMPSLVAKLKGPVSMIASCGYTTLVLTDNGYLFMWGDIKNKCGLEFESSDFNSPCRIINFKLDILDILAVPKQYLYVIRTEDGIYKFGDGQKEGGFNKLHKDKDCANVAEAFAGCLSPCLDVR